MGENLPIGSQLAQLQVGSFLACAAQNQMDFHVLAFAEFLEQAKPVDGTTRAGDTQAQRGTSSLLLACVLKSEQITVFYDTLPTSWVLGNLAWQPLKDLRISRRASSTIQTTLTISTEEWHGRPGSEAEAGT